MQFETKCRDCRERVTLQSESVDFFAINSIWSIDIGHDQKEIKDKTFLEYAEPEGFSVEAQAKCPKCDRLIIIEPWTKGVPLEAWPPVLRPTVAEDIETDKKHRGESNKP